MLQVHLQFRLHCSAVRMLRCPFLLSSPACAQQQDMWTKKLKCLKIYVTQQHGSQPCLP
jgi:hypothetical protein